MADLIERDKAIDAVGNYWKAEVDDIPKDTGFETLSATCDLILKHNASICKALKEVPSAQPDKDALDDAYAHGYTAAESEFRKRMDAQPEQPESAKEYCAKCNHIEMCRWYPYEGCEFRSLPYEQPELGKNTMPEQPQMDRLGVKTGETCKEKNMKINDVVQFTEEHKWAGCFGFIREDKGCEHPRRYMIGVPVPEQGVAYIFDDGKHIEKVGEAVLVMEGAEHE